MNHTRAIELLPLLASRATLAPESASGLADHLADCRECREWLKTWELLSDPRVAADSHLDSEELCSFALGAPELDAEAQERCRHHVANCVECAGEVDLVRTAVREPEDAPLPFAVPTARRERPAVFRHAWLALAATLALIVGGLVITERVTGPVPDDYRLFGDSVQGNRSIEASHSILVETTKVESGSILDLRSEVIAFGDGFSVDAGAVVVAGTVANGS